MSVTQDPELLNRLVAHRVAIQELNSKLLGVAKHFYKIPGLLEQERGGD